MGHRGRLCLQGFTHGTCLGKNLRRRPTSEVNAVHERCMFRATPNQEGRFVTPGFLHPRIAVDSSQWRATESHYAALYIMERSRHLR